MVTEPGDYYGKIGTRGDYVFRSEVMKKIGHWWAKNNPLVSESKNGGSGDENARSNNAKIHGRIIMEFEGKISGLGGILDFFEVEKS